MSWRRARQAAIAAKNHPDVVAVSVLGPDEGPHDAWTLELTCVDAGPGVSDGVLRVLADHRLSCIHISPQGCDHRTAVAVT